MALNHVLLEQNQQLQREKDIALANCDFLQHQLNLLQAETEHYTDVPELWREHVDSSIDFWQTTFSTYCYDVNRATLRVFLASHSNYKQTEKNCKMPSKLVQCICYGKHCRAKKAFHFQYLDPTKEVTFHYD